MLCRPVRERPGKPGWTRQSNATVSVPPDGEPMRLFIEYVHK